MSATVKKISKDTTFLGDQAPTQPVSGIKFVSGRVKGFCNMAFTRMEDSKKSI